MTKVVIPTLTGCPLTAANVKAANDIFGPNLGLLKGKTIQKSLPHAPSTVYSVPDHVLSRYRDVHLAIDIMFVNCVLFLLTGSRFIRFGTVDALPNWKANTVAKSLTTVANLYKS